MSLKMILGYKKKQKLTVLTSFFIIFMHDKVKENVKFILGLSLL